MRVKREGADISFMVSEAATIPFDPERFDVVVAVTILCFVANAAPVFSEIARVLRRGGVLVIGELGKWSLWATPTWDTSMRRERLSLGCARSRRSWWTMA